MPNLPDVEWSSSYPTAQDTDPIQGPGGAMEELENETSEGAGDGHRVRTSAPNSLAEKLQAVAKIVGDDSNLPVGCLRDLVDGLDTDLYAHTGSTSNPHAVTQSQVGLSVVTNDAQLKRTAGDINSFTLKPSPVAADLLLLEDSEDTMAKKKVTVGTLALPIPRTN